MQDRPIIGLLKIESFNRDARRGREPDGRQKTGKLKT
jgi:hypothetical protein